VHKITHFYSEECADDQLFGLNSIDSLANWHRYPENFVILWRKSDLVRTGLDLFVHAAESEQFVKYQKLSV
jgi:hypothetical protein